MFGEELWSRIPEDESEVVAACYECLRIQRNRGELKLEQTRDNGWIEGVECSRWG